MLRVVRKRFNHFILVSMILAMISNLFVLPPTLADNTSLSPSTMSLAFPQEISDWEIDNKAGYIYAIAATTNKLFFIRTSDLTIEKELLVGSLPVDLARQGNKLYIALAGATLIQAVDLATKSLAENYQTTQYPRSIAVTSTSLFYSVPVYGDVFKLDKASGNEAKLTKLRLSTPILAIDESTNTLFAGETGTSGSDVVAYNYITDTISSRSQYDGGYGFAYPNNRILSDETSVYYAGARMNKDNLKEMYGQYPRFGTFNNLDSKILDVNDRYVVTAQAVFAKNTYQKVADLPFITNNATEATYALLGDSNRVFVFRNQSIEAYDLDYVPVTANLTRYNAKYIKSDYPITSWTTNDQSDYIYGVSSMTNEWFVLNKSDLSLIKKEYIGSNPTDIQLQDNQLYIALRGTTNVSVIDTVYSNTLQTVINRVQVDYNPMRVYPASSKLLYATNAFGDDIRVTSAVYDSVTSGVYGEAKFPYSFYASAIVVDQPSNTLYGATFGTLYKLNLSTFGVISSSNNYYEQVRLQKDGEFLYYGNKRINESVTSMVYGTYPENVLYAKGTMVFGSKAVYDRDTFVKIRDLPVEVNKVFINTDGTIFMSTVKGIYRFDSFAGMDAFFAQAGRTPSMVLMIDEDLREGQFSGYLTFKAPLLADTVTGYLAYFIDANGWRISPIGMYLEKEYGDFLIYRVFDTYIPSNAVSIGIYSYVHNSSTNTLLDPPGIGDLIDAPKYFTRNIQLIDNDPATNRFVGTVRWNPGSFEPAQSKYNLYVLHDTDLVSGPVKTVQGGNTSYSVDLSLLNLPASAVGIAIALELKNGFEAPIINFKLFTESTSGSGSGGTGGSTGGGGSGGVIIGGGAPGVVPVLPPTDPIDVKLDSTEKGLQVVAGITPENFKKLYDDLAKAGGSDLLLDVTSVADLYDFKLAASSLKDLLPNNDDMTLTLQTAIGGIRFPVSSLQHLLSDGSEKDQLQFMIEKIAASDQLKLDSTISKLGGSKIGNALAFELYVIDKTEQKIEINQFSDYIGHTIMLPDKFQVKEGEVLVGAVWDPKTNTLNHVPVTYVPSKDGKPGYVTLWRQGNSIYTLYSVAKSFADLPASHYAKSAVDTLAANQIIDGFEDGTFRSEADVTRAQFAAMLVRALGLMSAAAKQKDFSDVLASDWYYSVVQSAASAGLISGYEDNTFRPNETISHQEAITMLANAQKFINSKQTMTAEQVHSILATVSSSIEVDAWATESAALAVTSGLVMAQDRFPFEKTKKTNRGETALWIARLLEKAQWSNQE
ncbi:S-layer homology domain-containing protein [Paenibacillus koleovorans]|uniref:S-layer homology domain-containing protein n=1 Tax=Paenibacillus koleovorans TaxID=121608 RepID=UPI0013E2A0D6|nr:S-layer homology domain-containing protein [Paenibacillus koleovorans]